MRRVSYGPSTTFDAIPGGGEQAREPTGMTVERGGAPGYNSQKIVAMLPDSAASYYLMGRSDGRCELWHIGSGGGGDPGADPGDAEAIREQLAAADRAYRRSPTRDAAIALGRAVRARDSARLRAINVANRNGPTRVA